MPEFVVCLLVLLSLNCVQSLYKSDDIRSSYLSVSEDYVLVGHVTTVLLTRGITPCAQKCLSMPGCLSFNFAKVSNVCELNNSSSQSTENLAIRPGFVHGYWINVAPMKFVFTTLGAQGSMGPSNATGYLGSTLEGQVYLNNGIQEWVVPYKGKYLIEAFGASGANGTCTERCSGWTRGGRGAKITGLFELQRGQRLKILVGQRGQITHDFKERSGGGGGGTFVTLMDNSPLVIAGGGGGGSMSTNESADGDPGQAGHNGTRNGGTKGLGGQKSSPGDLCGTGAGLWGDGKGMTTRALSFSKGGNGAYSMGKGGFGGGGNGWVLPGGGGGYSGGGMEASKFSVGNAGGGGSINNGSSQVNERGVNKGDGKAVITLIT